MAVLSLPLSFTNSFWSQDYRKGLEVLFQKLEQGVAENDEIVAFIRARVLAESQMAASLINPAFTGPAAKGFGADDGAYLLIAFRGLQAESVAQGQAHHAIAKELETLVLAPFAEWSQGYKERLKQSRHTVLDSWLRAYEHAQGDVAKLNHHYLTKVRKADEAEDDAKFAPTSKELSDPYTTSPRVRPTDGHRSPPQRTASVSERIANRLKEIQKKSVGALTQSHPHEQDTLFSAPPESDHGTPKIDKGKGRAIEEPESPPPMSPPLPPSKISVDIPIHSPSSPMPPMPPPPILLAGISLPPAAVSQLLTKAAADLPLRPVRFPLLGEYQDCFNGEEFVMWLKENVQAFGGSLDRAEDAAKDLTEVEDLLRRVGEFGNQFESSDDAFYQFRPKAFDLEGKNKLPVPEHAGSPIIKRTNNFVSLVSKALTASTNGSEPHHIKLRREAEEADKVYRTSVRKLDRQRLGLEERLEETLKTLQRWESERLRAVKSVLLQYHGTLRDLPKSLEPSLERSGTLIAAYQPETDLIALIERYRTGPFRPDAQVYESVAHAESDVVFGIDLRKWAEGGWSEMMTGEGEKDTIPPVVTALLNAAQESYGRLPNDIEKRKAWIYEVPLAATHHLRENLNSVPPGDPYTPELFAKYDAPVIASTVKLWLLELDPPIFLYEGWEEFRKLYPRGEDERSEQDKLRELGAALQRLPRVHLYVLDAIVGHLVNLMKTTTVEEEDEVYITKLALSLGRSVIRPKFENELSIQDRHPTLLLIDLLKHYDDILPPTIARKKRESERKIPIRKRTAPIDMRMSRSRMSISSDVKQLLAAEHAAKNGTKSPEMAAATVVPPLPPMSVLSPPPPPPVVVETLATPSPPPPPPVAKPVTPPLVPPPPPPADFDLPARPAFKEPPPELEDDVPPRPAFKEPPPELEDEDLPPRPKFIDPPPEVEDAPSAGSVVTTPSPPISPPATSAGIPKKAISPTSSVNVSSRSPSPSVEAAKANLSRASSGGVRGPRGARGPRPPGGGTVSSLVNNLNRNSVSSTGSPTSPTFKRLSGSPSRRPSSLVKGAGSLSRRTVMSDAEDDLLEKK